jgi:uncharacterized protein involved in tolerance to divalent cations
MPVPRRPASASSPRRQAATGHLYRREHPREVPSVVAVPIINGSSGYIGWSLEDTGPR